MRKGVVDIPVWGRGVGRTHHKRPGFVSDMCGCSGYRLGTYGMELCETMSGFINYDLMHQIERVVDAGVIKEIGDDKETEERHLSELSRRIAALDDVEVYTVITALVKHHRDTFIKVLENMEGEKQ